MIINHPLYPLINAKAHLHSILVAKVSIGSKNILNYCVMTLKTKGEHVITFETDLEKDCFSVWYFQELLRCHWTVFLEFSHCLHMNTLGIVQWLCLLSNLFLEIIKSFLEIFSSLFVIWVEMDITTTIKTLFFSLLKLHFFSLFFPMEMLFYSWKIKC